MIGTKQVIAILIVTLLMTAGWVSRGYYEDSKTLEAVEIAEDKWMGYAEDTADWIDEEFDAQDTREIAHDEYVKKLLDQISADTRLCFKPSSLSSYNENSYGEVTK
ncbi:MAG: hypothetical protein R8M45_04900 [Ghiorsea sp.]